MGILGSGSSVSRARAVAVMSASVGALVVLVVGDVAWGQVRDGIRYNGPLNAGGGVAKCLSAKPGSLLTFGGDTLSNFGRSDVRILDIRLTRAHGVRLVTAYLVPSQGKLVGEATQFPPPSDAIHQPGLHWAERRSAFGAVIPLTKGPETVNNLVTVVKVTGRSNVGFESIAVVYQVGWIKRTTHTEYEHVEIKVAPDRCYSRIIPMAPPPPPSAS